jgi:hypothetical protein
MCVGDWRLGRTIRTKLTNASLAPNGTLVINPSMQRVGIDLCMLTEETLVSQYLKITVDATDYAVLWNVANRLHLDFTKDGDLPTHQFTLTAVVTTVVVCVCEYFLPEDVIAAGLQEFQGDYNTWLKQH